MPTLVHVKIKDNGTFAYLRGLETKAINIGKRETWNLTRYGAKALKQSALNAGLHPFSPHGMFTNDGIYPEKIVGGKNQTIYGINIPIHAQYQDRMPPHWVSFGKYGILDAWAREKGVGIKKGSLYGIPKGSIYVKPHPFIESGYAMMISRLDIIANRIANGIEKG